MKLLIASILVLFSVATSAQTSSVRGKQFELTGKIINTISLPPPCGTIAWGTVIEFKIMTFSDPTYKADTIAVIVTCPEFYKDNFFKTGHHYRMTVADENQADFGWTIPNEAILKNYKMEKKLWAISAESLK